MPCCLIILPNGSTCKVKCSSLSTELQSSMANSGVSSQIMLSRNPSVYASIFPQLSNLTFKIKWALKHKKTFNINEGKQASGEKNML